MRVRGGGGCYSWKSYRFTLFDYFESFGQHNSQFLRPWGTLSIQVKSSLTGASLGRYPSDFPLSFEAVQHITIGHAYNNEPNTEHMIAGKKKGQPKKRFLISFDTKKIPRRAIIHSARLYLYLAEFGASDVRDDVVAIPSNSLEIYQITSTDWHPANTTSVIPWHQDYLGIGTDVAKNKYV